MWARMSSSASAGRTAARGSQSFQAIDQGSEFHSRPLLVGLLEGKACARKNRTSSVLGGLSRLRSALSLPSFCKRDRLHQTFWRGCRRTGSSRNPR